MKLIIIILLTISTSFGANMCEINPDLKSIFKQVSEEYSVSYELLSKLSWIESNHRVHAKAPTSSASGLFQIIRSTENWLREICNIEGDIFDPLTNTRMGACYIKHNTNYLKNKLNRQPTSLELYFSHFFGGRKALKFIQQPENTKVSNILFSCEISSNRGVFYKDGKLKTYRQVKDFFIKKLNGAKVL